jgi:hypothetical protein
MTIEVERNGARSMRSAASLPDAGLWVEHYAVIVGLSDPRGTGDSVYKAKIRPSSFAALAQAMMHAAPEEAIKAFGAALQAGTPEPVPFGKSWVPGASS